MAWPGASADRPGERCDVVEPVGSGLIRRCRLVVEPVLSTLDPFGPPGRDAEELDEVGDGLEGRIDGRFASVEVDVPDEEPEELELVDPLLLVDPVLELLLGREELLPVEVEEPLPPEDDPDGVDGVVGVAVGAGPVPGRLGRCCCDVPGASLSDAVPGSRDGRSVGVGRGEGLVPGGPGSGEDAGAVVAEPDG
ncbi:hypothetical protein [Barrientosiimonas humi]|uniref:hypothetical protein n=1 Tax=Barrientosiimonas humi TaxID=999931 RepID=UPI00370D0E61